MTRSFQQNYYSCPLVHSFSIKRTRLLKFRIEPQQDTSYTTDLQKQSLEWYPPSSNDTPDQTPIKFTRSIPGLPSIYKLIPLYTFTVQPPNDIMHIYQQPSLYLPFTTTWIPLDYKTLDLRHTPFMATNIYILEHWIPLFEESSIFYLKDIPYASIAVGKQFGTNSLDVTHWKKPSVYHYWEDETISYNHLPKGRSENSKRFLWSAKRYLCLRTGLYV